MLQTYRGTVVNQWFHKKRGKAVALIASSQQVLVNFGLCQICERRHHFLVGCDEGHVFVETWTVLCLLTS